MKKKTMADKLAEKAFNRPDFQKSWAVHLQAFGPILEPAFADNYQAKVHLTAALNNISRKELQQGLDKMKKLQASCETNADKAAWLFFLGLLFESAGDIQQSISFYRNANEFHHRFYMPYLKVAKSAHADGMFEIAEENYRSAINCFTATGLDTQAKTILASAYTNLATCLIMMQRFDEGESALATSRQLLPDTPARSATEAVLCAVRGDEPGAMKHLALLESYFPPALEQTERDVKEILSGTHIQFHAIPLDENKIAGFWQWFLENDSMMRNSLEAKEYDSVLAMLTKQLQPLFPFAKREPDFGILMEEDHVILELADCFAVSMHSGYEQLISACPEALKDYWQFSIIH